MILLVSLRSRLQAVYGPDGWNAIHAKIADYLAFAGRPAALVYLDSPDDMGPLGLAAVQCADPGAVLLGIRAVRGKIPGIDAVLLIGGHDILPFWQINNPVTDRRTDPDPTVFTDNPYGTTSDTLEEYLSPALPVGRLPDSRPASAPDFVNLIGAVTDNHRARLPRFGSTVVVNGDWAESVRDVAALLPTPADLHRTPDYRISSANLTDTDRRYLYFNLHGFDDDAAWKGFDSVRGHFFAAATPDSFDSRFVSGSVAYAENCYGASVRNKNPQTSCALRLLQQGVAGFIGATGLAFGSHLAPNLLLENADLLAQRFFQAAATAGATLGGALVAARQQYLADIRQSMDNAFKQKTLLQFVLFGDPSLT